MSNREGLSPDELREALTVDGAVSFRALLACAYYDAPEADRLYAARLIEAWRRRLSTAPDASSEGEA